MMTINASFRQSRVRIYSLLAACALMAGVAHAQSPAPRIASEINSSELTVLKGSQHPMALAQNDAGRMPADTRLSGISLYFSRSAAQQADLNALLVAQQDPASPLYHQWLTPDQFAARFGMAQSDIDAVQNWLQQQGFSIDSVARSRNVIRFSGNVGQVEAAFSTQMHYYKANGETHFAPSTALSVPAALAGSVAAIRNLDSFRPKPMHITPQSRGARPGFTSSVSGSVFFAPGDIATTYDIKPLYSASMNGTGQSIAIMGQSAITVSDIENFESAAGLTTKDPTLVLMPGTGASTTYTGDESESDLDLEWSGAIAQGANLFFVYTGNNTNYGVFDSAQYAVDEDLAPIISMSYASCEPELSAGNVTTLESIFSQAAAQGQTVVSASGDQGSTSCSGYTGLTAAQQEVVAVNYPASSAYVTGVGGTEITAANSVSTNGTYWLAESTSDEITSALKYIPEVAWNDDEANCTSFSAGCLSASGGGASSLFTKPSWQAGVPGIPSDGKRDVPDVAFYSSPNYPGYLYCTSDQSSWDTQTLNPQVASCNSGFRDNTTGDLTIAGGTSFAAPIFAGMIAIINQDKGYASGQGVINKTLYTLASNSATYASAFHDVTTGNNDCTSGSNICASTTGFSAGTGYDQVTGLGSVDLASLVAAWPANTGSTAALIATSTSVSAANTAPNAGASDTFTITVSSDNGASVPTGNVTLQIDGGAAFGGTTVAAQPLAANGTLTYTTSFTSAGTHQVLAQYAGDATHAASTGVASVSIVVTSSNTGTFKLSATNLTVAQGSQGSSTITVTPSGGYTGTVYLAFDTSNDSALQNLCYEFSNTLSSGLGSVGVTGTTPATTQLTLDTNAADCATAAAVASTGKHAFSTLHSAASLKKVSKNTGSNPLPAGVAFAGLLLAGLMGRSKKLRNLACMIALAAGGLALTACGSSSINNTVPNPPKGTYTITLQGEDSTTATNTASTTFTFVIN